MKNLKSIFVIVILTLTSSQFYSQEYNLGEKTITGVFEVEGKSKSELFSSINRWISINYNSSKNVIQMNDLESGTIIIKGVNDVSHYNTNKIFLPHNGLVTNQSTTILNHLIEINIKANRFRVKFEQTGIYKAGIGFDENLFKCLNFKKLEDDCISNYNQIMNTKLKKSLTGKKKREKYILNTKPRLEKVRQDLIIYIKVVMLSIQKSVIDNKKDKW